MKIDTVIIQTNWHVRCYNEDDELVSTHTGPLRRVYDDIKESTDHSTKFLIQSEYLCYQTDIGFIGLDMMKEMSDFHRRNELIYEIKGLLQHEKNEEKMRNILKTIVNNIQKEINDENNSSPFLRNLLEMISLKLKQP